MIARRKLPVAPPAKLEDERAALKAAFDRAYDRNIRFAERPAALRALATLASNLAANAEVSGPDEAARQLGRGWDDILAAARSGNADAFARELQAAINGVVDLWPDLMRADPLRELTLTPAQVAQIRRAVARKAGAATPEWLAAWVGVWVGNREAADRGDVMPARDVADEKARISRRQVRAGDTPGSRRPRSDR